MARGLTTLSLLFLLLVTPPLSAVAEECVLTVTRIPCPAHEELCYSKCRGQLACVEHSGANTREACAHEALLNCRIYRSGITRAKQVTATFNGEPLNDGKDFCVPARPEFNWNICAADR